MYTPLPWKTAPASEIGKDWLVAYTGTDLVSLNWIVTTDRLHASECNGSDAKDDAEFIVKACNSHHEACNSHHELLEALKDLFGLIEDGSLVRNTDKDHESDWALKQIPFVQKLKAAETAIKGAE